MLLDHWPTPYVLRALDPMARLGREGGQALTAMRLRPDSARFSDGPAHCLADQHVETRIAAECVESSVDLDTAENAGVKRCEIFVTFLQQSQRFILISQGQVDHRKRIRRNITLLRLIR